MPSHPCPSIYASVSSLPFRRGRSVIRRQPGSVSACPVPAAGRNRSARRGGSRPNRRVAITPRTGSRRKPTWILTTCEARPTIFLHELRDALAEHGVQTSTGSLSGFFTRHGITRKKGDPRR